MIDPSTLGLPWEKRIEILVCPGCQRWQLDYAQEAVMDLARFGKNLGEIDLSLIDEVIEGIIGRHVAFECTDPRRVFELYREKQRGRR